jgi:glyoxylase-like metal-dependent hydrolase (beta-lactamase superfamily II)
MLKNSVPLYPISVPTPFDVGPVNMYLITEPEPVLVDTGPGLADSLEVLKKLLGERGVALERLRKIVLTHAHHDHCGMAAPLREISGAPIYASPLEGEALRMDPQLGAFYIRMMEQAGLSEEMVGRQREHIQAVRGMGEPVNEFRPIEELGALRCGPSTFRTVPTPGHTPGSISLWDAERRILIAGDTVIKKITPNPFLAPEEGAANGRFRSLQNYMDTLGRIRDLRPALIHCGHGEPVEDFNSHYEWLMTHHQNRLEAVRACLRRKPHTPQEVAVCLFPEAAREGSFLAVSEVYAHLDLLEEAGEVRRRMQGGVAIYSIETP